MSFLERLINTNIVFIVPCVCQVNLCRQRMRYNLIGYLRRRQVFVIISGTFCKGMRIVLISFQVIH